MMIGSLDKQGYELANRVYHRGGCCPTQRANIEKSKVIKNMSTIKKAKLMGNFFGFGTSFDGAVYYRGGVVQL